MAQIRMLKTFKGYGEDSLQDFGATENARLVSLGYASNDLDGPDGESVQRSATLDAELAAIGVPVGTTTSKYGGVEISACYARPATDYQVVGAGSSIAVDGSVARSGAQTLKVTLNRGSAAPTDVNPIHTLPALVTIGGRVGAWVYVPDYTLLSSIVVKVSHGVTNYSAGAFQTYSFADADKMFNGWHFVGFDLAEFSGAYGTPDWTANIAAVRLSITQNSSSPAVVYIDKWVSGWVAKARIMITADDGWRSWFDYAIPVLNALGLKSTAAIISAQVDSDTQWVTSAQLASAYAAGHDLVAHGANAMSDVSFASDADRLANINTNKDYLTSRGYTRGTEFYVWPNGVHYLAGSPDGMHQLLASAGFLAARGTTSPKTHKHAIGTSDQKWLLPIIGAWASDSVATLKSRIDSSITYGATGILMYHDIVLSGATGVQSNLSSFYQVMEYIAQKRASGLCDVITASQFISAM